MIRYGQLVKLTKPLTLRMSMSFRAAHEHFVGTYEQTSKKEEPYTYFNRGYGFATYAIPAGTIVMLSKIYFDSKNEYVEAKVFDPVTHTVCRAATLAARSIDVIGIVTESEAEPYVEARNKYIAKRAKNGLEAALKIDKLCV